MDEYIVDFFNAILFTSSNLTLLISLILYLHLHLHRTCYLHYVILHYLYEKDTHSTDISLDYTTKN